jgi:Uma2 family endonuclease
MDATAERMTVDDYYAITVEGDRKQLVDGAIIVNEPRLAHSLIQARILVALSIWASKGAGRGVAAFPTDVRLDDYNLFGPDLIWIAEENKPPTLHAGLLRVPDICVEIRSPSTWHYDTGKKKEAYERGGCPELWLVDDRARAVTVHRRSRPDAPAFDVEILVEDVLTSPQLPGFALAVERIFRDP